MDKILLTALLPMGVMFIVKGGEVFPILGVGALIFYAQIFYGRIERSRIATLSGITALEMLMTHIFKPRVPKKDPNDNTLEGSIIKMILSFALANEVLVVPGPENLVVFSGENVRATIQTETFYQLIATGRISRDGEVMIS